MQKKKKIHVNSLLAQNKQVDQLDPSGILVHGCEVLGHHFQQTKNKQTKNKQTNKYLGKKIHASNINSQLFHLPLILAL